MPTPAIAGATAYPLVPSALGPSGRLDLQRVMQDGITPQELAQAHQGVEAWRERYKSAHGDVPDGDANAWRQASYFAQAVQNNFTLQQLRAGLKAGDAATLRQTFEDGRAQGGLRESLGAMSRAELHQLATHLDPDGDALGSRFSLAEHLMQYPGVRLDGATATMLRASLPADRQREFSALYHLR